MSREELEPGEPHPAYISALKFMNEVIFDPEILGAFSSCAIEGNRLSEICLETMRRLRHKEPVSDRYLLGLAWTLKELKEKMNHEI